MSAKALLRSFAVIRKKPKEATFQIAEELPPLSSSGAAKRPRGPRGSPQTLAETCSRTVPSMAPVHSPGARRPVGSRVRAVPVPRAISWSSIFLCRSGGDILFDCEPASRPEQAQDSSISIGVVRLI